MGVRASCAACARCRAGPPSTRLGQASRTLTPTPTPTPVTGCRERTTTCFLNSEAHITAYEQRRWVSHPSSLWICFTEQCTAQLAPARVASFFLIKDRAEPMELSCDC
eukprot:6174866-Pleurochrysis_carterae.AAC.3